MKQFYSPSERVCYHEAISGQRRIMVPDPDWCAPKVEIVDPSWVRPMRLVAVTDAVSGEPLKILIPDESVSAPVVEVPDPSVCAPLIEVINSDCEIPSDAVEITEEQHKDIMMALNSPGWDVVMKDGHPVAISALV